MYSKIIVFQPVVPQYRIGFFESLNAFLNGRLEVCATQQTQRGFSVKTGSETTFFLRNIRTISVGSKSRKLLFQPYAVFAGFRKKISVIITMNQMTRLDVWFLLLTKKIHRKKVILWGHGCSPRDGRMAKRIRPWMMRLADALIVYSDGGKKRSVEAGVPAKKIFIAPNSLDTAKMEKIRVSISDADIERFVTQQGWRGKQRFLFVGRLVHYKRLDLFVDAIDFLKDRFPDILGIIVGDGPERESLEQVIRTRGLEGYIQLQGAVYEEKTLALYFLSSFAGVMPTAAGLFIQHAFQYQLPVITDDDLSAHGPEIELLEHKKTGLVFNSQASQGLASAMEELLGNPEQQVSMAHAAYGRVMQKNRIENMVEGFGDAIDFSCGAGA